MMQAAKQRCNSQNGFGVRLQARLKRDETLCARVQVRHSAADHLRPVVFLVLVTPTHSVILFVVNKHSQLDFQRIAHVYRSVLRDLF